MSLLLLSSGLLAAQGLSLRPEIGLQTGTEVYEFEAAIESSNPSVTDLRAKSTLTYPVASALAGAVVDWGSGRFGLFAAARTNFGDPFGKMLDQDFVSGTAGGASQSIEFSHTESRTTMRTWHAELGGRVQIGEPNPDYTLHALAGLRYESNAFDVYGASGWQLDGSGNQRSFTIEGEPHALHYESKYVVPFLGARFDVRAGDRFSAPVEARALVSFSTHDDDHLLRHKKAHAASQGLGFLLAAAPGVHLGEHVRVGLDAEIAYIRAITGKLRQSYYADDPTIAGDQTATAIPDGNFTFTNFRLRALAFVEARF